MAHCLTIFSLEKKATLDKYVTLKNTFSCKGKIFLLIFYIIRSLCKFYPLALMKNFLISKTSSNNAYTKFSSPYTHIFVLDVMVKF